MTSLIGCGSLCDAPANFVQHGLAGDAETVLATNAINVGTARETRLLFCFGDVAGNKIVSVQFSDDGETWYTCDADLTATLGDTEGKQLISLCLSNSKAFVRAEIMSPNGFCVISELANFRYSDGCCNEATAQGSLDCDDLTLVEVEEVKTEETKR